MVELEDALARILQRIPPPVAERVPLAAAGGRVLARSLNSPLNLPPLDNSAVDGYAVRAADVAPAAVGCPVKLRVAGRAAAGEMPGTIQPGECLRLFTGSILPQGADAVVMQEDTRADPQDPDHVSVLEPVGPWENVRLRGGDVERHSVLTQAGELLTTGRIGLLAATGIDEVMTATQPRVGLVSTGSELIEPGAPWSPGAVYDSNRIMLARLTQSAGGLPRVFPLVPDVLADTRRALAQAFSACDLVVTTGGASVGETDFVKQAFQEAGGKLEFWKVNFRPGRPFAFGTLDSKLFFGLPGNPASALVTFLLLVRPALLRWQGAAQLELPAHEAPLSEPLSNPGGSRCFVRVCQDASGKVALAGAQGSHMLSSMASATGLVDLPPKTELAAGSRVQVLRWD